MLTRIVVIIEGGLVQHVISDAPDTQVYTVDYDTYGMDEGEHPFITTVDGSLCFVEKHDVQHEPGSVSVVANAWRIV